MLTRRLPQNYLRITCSLYIADHFCQINDMGYSNIKKTDEEVLAQCLSCLDIKAEAMELIAQDVKSELEKMISIGLV